MRKTLTLSALAGGLLLASKGSTQTPPTAYAVPLPAQAVPQAYLPPPMPALPPRPPESAKLVTKVFDITEIILQVGTKGTPAAVADRAERLTALLEGFVEPSSWKCAGGRGSMVFFAENSSLVVNNESRVVATVGTWLDKLRASSKPEVNVGINRIRCDAATLAKLGFAGRKAHEPITLSPAQLAETMKVLEADVRFERLEAPRLCLLDNQTGFVQVGQHVVAPCPTSCPSPAAVPATFVGHTYRATPRIMPDRGTILLRLESEHCDAVLGTTPSTPTFQTQSAALSLAVPNGGTVLVPMGAERVTERVQTKVPVIADLPMFDKLFSHTRTEPRHYETFVLVTANTQAGPAAVPATLPIVTIQPATIPTMPEAPVAPKVDFVAAYRKACAEGRMVDARNFALQALAADPKCFETK